MEPIKLIKPKNSWKIVINTIIQVVTIDELMVSFRGKQKYVIYNPQKPSKYGFYPYKLTDSQSGKIIRRKS